MLPTFLNIASSVIALLPTVVKDNPTVFPPTVSDFEQTALDLVKILQDAALALSKSDE